MSKIDWTGELEAYHEDGRVVPVTLAQDRPDDDGDYVSNEEFRDGLLHNWYWTPEGFPSASVAAQDMKWRIRNRQPAPSTGRLDRLEAFVARVAERHGGEDYDLSEEARALVAELNPVDALEATISEAMSNGNDISAFEIAEAIRSSDAAYDALRQARKEGNYNEK